MAEATERSGCRTFVMQFSVVMGVIGIIFFVCCILPPVLMVREAAKRTRSQNNMKTIAVAMREIAMSDGEWPCHAIYGNDGKTPLLSWRVSILPQLGYPELYKQFHLDEPWDSEHNRTLIQRMPKEFADPFDSSEETRLGKTRYQVFVGGGAMFESSPNRIRWSDIPDGVETTILLGDAAKAVEWTRPVDLEFSPNWNKSALRQRTGGFMIILADSTSRYTYPWLDDATFKSLITRAGGEKINSNDW